VTGATGRTGTGARACPFSQAGLVVVVLMEVIVILVIVVAQSLERETYAFFACHVYTPKIFLRNLPLSPWLLAILRYSLWRCALHLMH
jgi:hypothetical protein